AGLGGCGDAAGVRELRRRVARGEGVGELLAEGSRGAAAQLGGGSLAWAMQVKGLELPGYEPRVLKALALALAVSPRGACHNRSSAYDLDFAGDIDPTEAASVATAVIEAEDRAAVLDSLTIGK